MEAAQVRLYLQRARDFLQGMRLLSEDTAEFGYSSALLAVHGAIAYSDAIRFGLDGGSLTSDDHSAAAETLKRVLTSRGYEKVDGVERLKRLLGSKTAVAYGQDVVQITKLQSLILQAERFAAWAETVGKDLRIEGWSDE